jgi:quercetin dioxygenase-like cupin family protein
LVKREVKHMAQPKREELRASPVGHAMIGGTLDISILQCDLLEEIQSLHKEAAWLQGTGPSSKTLVKHDDLRIVLLAMKKKMCMHEHMTTARISVQTLTGHIRLRLPDRTVELPAGQLLVLDQCVPHDVEAEEDSAFLLTLSWHGQESEIGQTD